MDQFPNWLPVALYIHSISVRRKPLLRIKALFLVGFFIALRRVHCTFHFRNLIIFLLSEN